MHNVVMLLMLVLTSEAMAGPKLAGYFNQSMHLSAAWPGPWHSKADQAKRDLAPIRARPMCQEAVRRFQIARSETRPANPALPTQCVCVPLGDSRSVPHAEIA